MKKFLEHFQDYIRAQDFHPDQEQEKVALALQNLNQAIKSQKRFSLFSKKEKPKGIYIYGGVGRGKSMIMDLFFDFVSPNLKKRRVHFHEFMTETHDWMHQHRGDAVDDLLMRYADHVKNEVQLLCFDEFQVNDVADAMILKRLFTSLMDSGIIIITTSNRKPDMLYEGGLQRDLFLPFIPYIKKEMTVLHLDSQSDYRVIADPDQEIYYFYPRDDDTKKKFDALYEILTEGHKPSIKKLKVKARTINVMATGDIARFTFYDLCEKPLGAEDYRAIAQKYDTIFIENIPIITKAMRNEAKRFIHLIDSIYEEKCRLVLSAETDIDLLYAGSDHAFEFDRTKSRLMEMQSAKYHDMRVSA
ncbi:MAG: cell division protein ZapE [Pseudomonadota bacterium]